MVRSHARELIRGQWLVLLALTVWAFGPLVAEVVHVARHGGTMTGVNGGDFFDQYQYLAWIRDEGSHVLARNLWVIGPTPHDYVQPMYLISGLLWWAGLSVQVAYLVWKPVAVLVLFGGVYAFIRRLLPGRRGVQAAALVLALFYESPAYAVAVWTGRVSFPHRLSLILASDDAVPALQLWGFEHTAIAIGCTAAFLIAIEKAIGAPGQRSRPFLVLASLSGLLMGWLNPWQALIALVVVAALFVLRPPRRRFLALAVPVAATVAPLIYSQILAHTDASWRAFSHAATATGTAPWWALVASLGPLIALAAVGIRRPDSEREWVLLLWPLGNAVVYFVVPDFPPHALAGVTVPLAVLAVRGFGRLRAALRAPAAVAVAGGLLALAAGTVPATINHVQSAADNLTPSFAGVFAQQQLRLTAAEARAMSYLSRAPASGGVLAPAILSLSVPAFTGRQVFVGHFQWEPAGRAAVVQAFFDPHATSGAIRRAILRSSHARFVISDCAALPGLTAQLSPLAAPVWHSGCVWIYRVRTSAA